MNNFFCMSFARFIMRVKGYVIFFVQVHNIVMSGLKSSVSPTIIFGLQWPYHYSSHMTINKSASPVM